MEKTPEAAMIVPSAPTNARSLAQAPLPSFLEPRDLPAVSPLPQRSSAYRSRLSLYPLEQRYDRPATLYP